MWSPTLAGRAAPQQSSLQAIDSSSYVARLLAVADDRQTALVNSYREIFPLKFSELVKVHLSFLLDMPSDFLSEEFHVESSPPPSPGSDGGGTGSADEKEPTRSRSQHVLRKLRLGKLLHHLQRSRKRAQGLEEPTNGPVEIHCVREDQLCNFRALIDFLLSEDNFAVEGLFRKCGGAARQRELDRLLASTRSVLPALASGRFSSHDAAAALKSGLSRLPEPLLTRRFASLFAAAGRLTLARKNDRGQAVPFAPGDLELLRAKQTKAFRLLFLLLPDTNRQLLCYLLAFLVRVAAHPKTRMCYSSLGIVLSPSLFASELSGSELSERHQHFAHTTAFLIESAPLLTRLPSSLATDVAANLSRISGDPLSTCVRYAATTPDASQHNATEEASMATQMAVAQLYAEVARWPPSERQRRMIRRLNNLNGGLIPQRSRCVGYLQRRVGDRQSVRRRLFGPSDDPNSFPNAILGTPVKASAEGPSLVSFGQTDPLSPEEDVIRWTPPLCKISRCSPGRMLTDSRNDHVRSPMVT